MAIIPIDVEEALKQAMDGDASTLQGLLNQLIDAANAVEDGTVNGTAGDNVLTLDRNTGEIMSGSNLIAYNNRYMHIRFSANSDGTNFLTNTSTFSSATQIFIGLSNTNSTTGSTVNTAYQWAEYTWGTNYEIYYAVSGGRIFDLRAIDSAPGTPFKRYIPSTTDPVAPVDIDLVTNVDEINVGSLVQGSDTSPSGSESGFRVSEDGNFTVGSADTGYMRLGTNTAFNNGQLSYTGDNFFVSNTTTGFSSTITSGISYRDAGSLGGATTSLFTTTTPSFGGSATQRSMVYNHTFDSLQTLNGAIIFCDAPEEWKTLTAYAINDVVLDPTNEQFYRASRAIPATNTTTPSTVGSGFIRLFNQGLSSSNPVITGDEITGFGTRRLVTPLPLVAFEFNLSASPANQTLNWDALPSSVNFIATNDANNRTKWVSQVTAATRGSTSLTVSDSNNATFVLLNTYTLAQNSAEGTNQFDGRDKRTGAVTSAGGSMTLTVTWRSSESATDTATSTSTYSWRAVPGMSVSTDIGNQNFDAVDTNYTVTVSYSNLSSNSTVVSHTVTPNTGFGSAQTNATPNRSQSYTFSGVSIYHDTTVAGSVSGSLVRPTTVSEESLTNRTVSRSGSWSSTPTTVYKVWAITSTTSNQTYSTATQLGTLGNGGYATAATSTSTSTTAWRSATYQSTMADSTPDTYYLVVPRQTGTTIFRNPTTNFQINPRATTNITLGHSGHTVNYTVYTFTVPANDQLNMVVRSS